MDKARKILQKVLAGSKNIRFAEFITLIKGFGFILDRVSGSHHIFKHPNVPMPFSVQNAKGKAKPYQIRLLLDWVDQYGLRLRQED